MEWDIFEIQTLKPMFSDHNGPVADIARLWKLGGNWIDFYRPEIVINMQWTNGLFGGSNASLNNQPNDV